MKKNEKGSIGRWRRKRGQMKVKEKRVEAGTKKKTEKKDDAEGKGDTRVDDIEEERTEDD